MRQTRCPRPVRGLAFKNDDTGTLNLMPCDRWDCRVCGKRKAYKLAAMASASHPERFITLSRVGPDLKTVYRRLQTLSQALRRRGYTWEYLAVPEKHQNGFWHLHILQRGDFIPQKVLSERAESAGMGRVVDIRKVSNEKQVPRYLIKYILKDSNDEQLKNSNRFRVSRGFWPGGKQAIEEQVFGPSAGGWSAIPSEQSLQAMGKCS